MSDRSDARSSASFTSATRTARNCRWAPKARFFFENGHQFEYHNDPAKTRSSRNARGWTTLGDIGRLDEEGYLYLTDRKSFVIISGGVNIYPQEVENLLLEHEAVWMRR